MHADQTPKLGEREKEKFGDGGSHWEYLVCLQNSFICQVAVQLFTFEVWSSGGLREIGDFSKQTFNCLLKIDFLFVDDFLASPVWRKFLSC